MNHETMHDIIRKRFRVQVADTEPVTTQYDNLPFTKPEDVLWVKWEINTGPGSSRLIELGSSSKTYRTNGIATAKIHAPLETGDEAALQLADVIKAAFRIVTDTGVKFNTPDVIPLGLDGGWYLVHVNCPFQADDIV